MTGSVTASTPAGRTRQSPDERAVEQTDRRSAVDGVADDLRPIIATSWQRTSASGLDPGATVSPHLTTPIDPGSRLLRAAGPVLDQLADELQDAGYTVMLADRDARLVDIRCGRRSLRPALEGVGAVVGRSFTEATTGTNSIATAYELRRGVAVHGTEHYLETFKRFACYGTPIRDPISRRLAGVLDITCLAEDANDLLRPFLTRGVRDIESRLLEEAGRTQRQLLDAFQAAARQSPSPLVAIGVDLVLTNQAAVDLLQPSDQAALHVLAADLSSARTVSRRCELPLASGATTTVTLSRVRGGVLASVEPITRPAPVPRLQTTRTASGIADWHEPLRAEIERCAVQRTSVLVHGETGTGLSSIAARLVGQPVLRVEGAAATASSVLAEVSRDRSATWLVTDLHLLRQDAAALLARSAERKRPHLVLTAAGPLTGHAAAVAALCPVRLALPSLRSGRERIPLLAANLLTAATGGRARFTAQALRTLADLDWPGNLRELRTVVDDVAVRRPAGDVTAADLPVGYRGGARPRVPGALWQAERDAVIAVLRSCGGNKVHAARALGISRNTLYRRLRSLHIDLGSVLDRATAPERNT